MAFRNCTSFWTWLFYSWDFSYYNLPTSKRCKGFRIFGREFEWNNIAKDEE